MVKNVMPKPISTILIGQDLVITCANTPKTGWHLGWSRHEEIGIGGPSQSPFRTSRPADGRKPTSTDHGCMRL